MHQRTSSVTRPGRQKLGPDDRRSSRPETDGPTCRRTNVVLSLGTSRCSTRCRLPVVRASKAGGGRHTKTRARLPGRDSSASGAERRARRCPGDESWSDGDCGPRPYVSDSSSLPVLGCICRPELAPFPTERRPSLTGRSCLHGGRLFFSLS